MNTWLVIGSSKSAREAVAYAWRTWTIHRTVTCNRGIFIEPHPDFYFLSDQEACKAWNPQAKVARNQGGTTTVTLQRDMRALQARNVAWFDLFVRNGFPYQDFTMSGLWCVEFAVRFGGANQVIMAGMEGYVDQQEEDYFMIDQFTKSIKGKNITSGVVEPRTQMLVEKYPDVQFIALGEPRYTVTADNWQVNPICG